MLDFDVTSLVKCFPEHSDEFKIEVIGGKLYIEHTSAPISETKVSRLVLSRNGDEVKLVDCQISKEYMGKGHGTVVLRELVRQCEQLRLELVVPTAHAGSHKILSRFVEENGWQDRFKVSSVSDKVWNIRLSFNS